MLRACLCACSYFVHLRACVRSCFFPFFWGWNCVLHACSYIPFLFFRGQSCRSRVHWSVLIITFLWLVCCAHACMRANSCDLFWGKPKHAGHVRIKVLIQHMVFDVFTCECCVHACMRVVCMYAHKQALIFLCLFFVWKWAPLMRVWSCSVVYWTQIDVYIRVCMNTCIYIVCIFRNIVLYI